MSDASAVAPTAPISSFVSDLDQLAAEVMADWKVPGAALAVVHDGKVALTRAYGQRDVEANLPVTTTTQFLICSITKSFTATAVALLHDEGRLDWTKPVRDYMPEFRLQRCRSRPSGSRYETSCAISQACHAMTGSIFQVIGRPPKCLT